MSAPLPRRIATAIGLALAAMLVGAIAGLGFAMWTAHGPQMLLAMSETAATWCF